MTKRIPALDALRGVLAVPVVAQHVCAAFGSEALEPVARTCVLAFFVLTGFVLSRGFDGDILAFAAKRLVRLWPLYAVCMVVGALIAGCGLRLGEMVWYPMIAYRDYPHADGAAWSLYYEVWSTPFLPLAFWLARWRVLAIAAVPASTVLSLIDVHFTCAPFFLLGVALAQFDLPFPSKPPRLALWLGQISYSIYLTHQLVLTAATRLAGPWGAVAAAPLVFVVAWAAYRYIEVPSIKWSRAIGRWTRKQPHGRNVVIHELPQAQFLQPTVG